MAGASVSPIDLRYYYEDTDRHGNVRRYFRKRIEGTTKYCKVRIRAELGTEDFHRQFAAALKGARTLPPLRPRSKKSFPGHYDGLSRNITRPPHSRNWRAAPVKSDGVS